MYVQHIILKHKRRVTAEKQFHDSEPYESQQ